MHFYALRTYFKRIAYNKLQDDAMVLEFCIVTSKQKKTEMVLILSDATENCKRKRDFLHAIHFSPQKKYKRSLNYLFFFFPYDK